MKGIEFFVDWSYVLVVLLRLTLSVIIGSLIGSERARHGRAAGMRTHILVALGACLTSLMSVYVNDVVGGGDIMRISAQVISGIGFLGAGMIILKDNNVITGLTTAAGVWTTSIIGISIGYGFYSGAIIGTILFLTAIILFAKFERRKKASEVIYIEIDDMYKTNEILKKIDDMLSTDVSYDIVAPKSGCNGHIGVHIIIEKRINFDTERILEIGNVVFTEER